MKNLNKALQEKDVMKLRETLQSISEDKPNKLKAFLKRVFNSLINKNMKKKEFIKQFNDKFQTKENVTFEALKTAIEELLTSFITDYETTRKSRCMFIKGRNTEALKTLIIEYQTKYRDIIFEINNHIEKLTGKRPMLYGGFFESLKLLDVYYVSVLQDVPL